MEKFKNRKEQREVTETMNALLLPTLSYLNADTAIRVKRALYLLGEIEVEPQESEEKPSWWLGKKCKDCGNEKCKKLGILPKGYDCALWRAESEDKCSE